MADSDMFLRLESQRAGWVKGESRDTTHKDEIQIVDWQWGMTSSPAVGGSSTALKTALSELHLFKLADSATTGLMSIMRNNDQVKKAVLSVRKAGGSQIDYMIITVEKARISSYDIRTQSAIGPLVYEHFTLSFESIEVDYYAQDEKGQRKGGSAFMAQVGA